MRKVFVLAFVALLVMLAVSCDSFNVLPGGEKPEYTADGERLVTVKINTSGIAGNRSLTNGFAKEQANYMEVIFEKNGKYYRASGPLSATMPLSITIPTGTYADDKAVMLIGRARDKTLLATGKLSTAPLIVTAADTSSIGFTVLSLNTDIYAGEDGFTIDEDTGRSSAAATTDDKPITDTDFADLTASGTYEGLDCFQVPTSTFKIKAILEFSKGFENTGSMIYVTSDANAVKFTKITDPTAAAPTATIVTPAAIPGAIGTSNKIEFLFDSPSAAGEYTITFAIPVVGFGTGAKGITWTIRGGTNEGPDFVGTEEGSVVIIVATEPAETLVTRPITNPTLP